MALQKENADRGARLERRWKQWTITGVHFAMCTRFCCQWHVLMRRGKPVIATGLRAFFLQSSGKEQSGEWASKWYQNSRNQSSDPHACKIATLCAYFMQPFLAQPCFVINFLFIFSWNFTWRFWKSCFSRIGFCTAFLLSLCAKLFENLNTRYSTVESSYSAGHFLILIWNYSICTPLIKITFWKFWYLCWANIWAYHPGTMDYGNV